MTSPALLILEDGSRFRGRSIGVPGRVVGEAVFNTAMTGYQEILTDPSYCRQIITLTYPHIGNVGTNPEDAEAARVFASALVVRDVPATVSNWRAVSPLEESLEALGVVDLGSLPRFGHRELTLLGSRAFVARTLLNLAGACGLAGPRLARRDAAAQHAGGSRRPHARPQTSCVRTLPSLPKYRFVPGIGPKGLPLAELGGCLLPAGP